MNLLTVFTAVECGRLLDAAKLPCSKKKKVNALDAEMLFRVAAGRLTRAFLQEASELAGREVNLDTLCHEPDANIHWVEDAHADVRYGWDPVGREVLVEWALGAHKDPRNGYLWY